VVEQHRDVTRTLGRQPLEEQRGEPARLGEVLAVRPAPVPELDRHAVAEAAAAGHRAIVLKSHDSPTASLAWAVQRDVGDAIAVFGGICCDREVGGMNPAAVEVALELGARIVWLPTLSSRQDFENGVAARLGIPGP